MLRYDLLAAAYGLLRGDPALIQGRVAALRALPHVLAARRAIQARVTVPGRQVARWIAPALSPRAALRARRDVDALLALPSPD